MEGIVVEVRVRARRKRFAIKDNSSCHCCERGIDDRKGKLHNFFSLRTLRVVTRVLDRGPIGSVDEINTKCHFDL